MRHADEMMNAEGYRAHEFGDSVLIERELISRVNAATDLSATAIINVCAPTAVGFRSS